MDKPISVIKRQFDDNLEKLINGCGLPPCLIVDTVRYVLMQLELAANDDYKNAVAEYNSELDGRLRGKENDDACKHSTSEG